MAYHPFYFGHNIGNPAVRGCLDRWTAIKGHLEGTKTLLDLGASEGYFSFSAANMLEKVTSVDFCDDLVAKNQVTAKQHNVENIEFILGDICQLEFEHHDTVLLLSVFHHLMTVAAFPKKLLKRLCSYGDQVMFDCSSQREKGCENYTWFEYVPKEHWGEYLKENSGKQNIEVIGSSDVHGVSRLLYKLW